jgi:hypothetical protein
MTNPIDPYRASADDDRLDVSEAAAAAVDRYWKALSSGDMQVQADEQASSSPATVSRGQLHVLDLLHAARQPSAARDTSAGRRDLPTTLDHLTGFSVSIWADGTLVGDELRILCLLDRGGMGEVYVAWHGTLNCEVAVKVLPKGFSTDPEAIGRFRKAIQAQAKLGGHEHIVATMNASEDQGRLYLVMEYVPGSNLSDYVEANAPIDWREACGYIRQVAVGLQHAHAQGVIHRDIKPSNVIRGTSGTIKILDWGLARCDALDSHAGKTRTGIGMGTDDYVAPEQIRDASRADQRSDLYSLGCTLYFLLAGHAPFAGESSQFSKLMAHESKRPPSILTLRADVPASVDAILQRLMAKRPAERFDSAQSLVEALDAAAEAPAARAGRRPWRAAALGVALGCGVLTWWILAANEQLPTPLPIPVEPARGSPPELEDLGMFFVPPQGDYQYVPFVTAQGIAPSPPARRLHPDEAFRIEGHFLQPQAWWLLWIDTRGQLDPPTAAGKRQREVGFPPSHQATTINPSDPPGTHVLLLVTADEQSTDASTLLIRAFQGAPSAPSVGFHFWSRSDGFGVLRGQGSDVATPQSYLDHLSHRLPQGFELAAAIFLPWEPTIGKPAKASDKTIDQ